jgi:glycosyltransferase involved in cell wall biosynthesis
LARALRRHGVQVVLATMGERLSGAQRHQAEQVSDLVLCESRWRLEWMASPWEDVARAGGWLLQLERRYRPDLIHLNHYCHGHLDWRAPCLVVGHSCVLSWWWGVFAEAAPASWNTYRRRVRRGLAGADAVVAPSQFMRAALERHYGTLRRPAVIYNGRMPEEYRTGKKRPYILAAGRLWDAAKNLDALAEVAPDLRWPVYLAGETRHPDGGSAVLSSGIRRLGRLAPEVLIPWYAQAAIYVSPARYEPFGLSVLEAALAGCAPVLGDIESFRELWGEAACFVPPDDLSGLRRALDALIVDRQRREAIAARAQARAYQYTAQRMGAGYLAVYDDLLSRRSVTDLPVSATSG